MREAQTDPLSVMELMEDDVVPSAHTRTTSVAAAAVIRDRQRGRSSAGAVFWVPPTREIGVKVGFAGVVKVKFAEVAVPAESVDITA